MYITNTDLRYIRGVHHYPCPAVYTTTTPLTRTNCLPVYNCTVLAIHTPPPPRCSVPQRCTPLLHLSCSVHSLPEITLLTAQYTCTILALHPAPLQCTSEMYTTTTPALQCTPLLHLPCSVHSLPEISFFAAEYTCTILALHSPGRRVNNFQIFRIHSLFIHLLLSNKPGKYLMFLI